jgi:membrane-bound lytic murein transglycosylase D
MSPWFFRRPLALAAAIAFSLPVLAVATPVTSSPEPDPQGAIAVIPQTANHHHPAGDAITPAAGGRDPQTPIADRQSTTATPGEEELAIQKALAHTSSGRRAVEAGDRTRGQQELEAAIRILSKLPEAVRLGGRRLQLIEEMAALKAGLSADSGGDDRNLPSESEEEADTEASPDLVNPQEEPAPESPDIKADSVADLDLSQFDVPVDLNEKVKAYIVFFQTKKRKVISEALDRSGRYLPMMREIFREHGLPLDLVNLAYIESGFKYRAFSRARAAGIWQFIKSTGRRYKLEINDWVDERRDPEKATRAAATYLKFLNEIFDDWRLSLASYNAGEQRVLRAIDRQGTKDYWSLRLPKETQLFVPAFMAMTIIAKDPERYGFDPPVERAWEVEQVRVPGAIDLQHIARAVNTTHEEMHELNPALRRGVTPLNRAEYEVNLPSGTKDLLLAQVNQLPRTYRPRPKVVRVARNQATDRYRVKPGDTLGKIAWRHRTTPTVLARLNGMRMSETLRSGVVLKLPHRRGSTELAVAPAPAKNSRVVAAVASKSAATVRSLFHVVRRGDTLWGIAKAYAVTPDELRRWNDLRPRDSIQPGQSLRVAVHASNSARIRYQVKRGDTLWDIARSHDVTPEDLRRWNDLTHRATLKVGQKLTIHLDRS